jgi:hypothetical protein
MRTRTVATTLRAANAAATHATTASLLSSIRVCCVSATAWQRPVKPCASGPSLVKGTHPAQWPSIPDRTLSRRRLHTPTNGGNLAPTSPTRRPASAPTSAPCTACPAPTEARGSGRRSTKTKSLPASDSRDRLSVKPRSPTSEAECRAGWSSTSRPRWACWWCRCARTWRRSYSRTPS